MRAPRRTEHPCGPPAPNASPQPGYKQQAVHTEGRSAVFLQHPSNSIKVWEGKTDRRAASGWRWPRAEVTPCTQGPWAAPGDGSRNEVRGAAVGVLATITVLRSRERLVSGPGLGRTWSPALALLRVQNYFTTELKILKLSFNPHPMSCVPIQPILNQIYDYFHVLIITKFYTFTYYFINTSHTLKPSSKWKVLEAADPSTI